MRLIGVLILTILFNSCKLDKTQVIFFHFQNYIIADTAIAANKYLLANIKVSDYPIYYIGVKQDTIKIGKRYWRGRTAWTIDPDIPFAKNYSDETLSIFVDTSIRTNCPIEYFSDDPKVSQDSTMNYHSFLFSITNISDSTLYLGRTFSVFFINREARDKSGNWIKVDKKLSELGICGTGEPTIILKPKELLISKVTRYKGSFETDFRLVFGYDNNIVYSNIFRDSIDERIFQTVSRDE